MNPRVILSIPRSLGHHKCVAVAAEAFGCRHIVHDWDGIDPLAEGTLAWSTADRIQFRSGSVLLACSTTAAMDHLTHCLARGIPRPRHSLIEWIRRVRHRLTQCRGRP